MNTTISSVLDMALTSLQDYKLNDLYTKSPSAFQTYLIGFLNLAIADFYDCKQSLEYDVSTGLFASDLTNLEKLILSRWIVYEWFVREVNNVLQFNGKLMDNNFKEYSEAQNLQQKSEYRDRTREIAMQLMSEYEQGNVNFKEWANGNFGI